MPASLPGPTTPSVKRRLLSLLYEGLLLTAVELVAVGLFLLLTGNRHSPAYGHALQFVLFLVTALYFIYFWSERGQTLAMKTWRIQLIKPGYARLPLRVAVARFLLAWGWFLPALMACYAFNLNTEKEIAAALLVGMAGWALTAFLDQDRQFLHDRLLGTRLVLRAQKPR